jgi:hypothetical protein
MRPENRKTSGNFAELRAAYEFQWRRLLAEVERWQSLQEEDPASAAAIQEAEACARTAHERYREARNALADYLAERAEAKILLDLESSAPYLLSFQTAVSS